MRDRTIVAFAVLFLGVVGCDASARQDAPFRDVVLTRLTCVGTEEVTVSAEDRTVRRSTRPDVVYRFADAKLFITNGDRPEYLYGDVRQIEFERYASSYKTIVFPDRGIPVGPQRSPRDAISTHVDEYETRVTFLRCTDK